MRQYPCGIVLLIAGHVAQARLSVWLLVRRDYDSEDLDLFGFVSCVGLAEDGYEFTTANTF